MEKSLSNFNKIIKGTVAVNNVANQYPIVIYPNPASHFIEITNVSSIDDVELVGINGSYHMQDLKDGHVDVSELPAGYYTLRLYDTDSGRKYVRSLIIQR